MRRAWIQSLTPACLQGRAPAPCESVSGVAAARSSVRCRTSCTVRARIMRTCGAWPWSSWRPARSGAPWKAVSVGCVQCIWAGETGVVHHNDGVAQRQVCGVRGRRLPELPAGHGARRHLGRPPDAAGAQLQHLPVELPGSSGGRHICCVVCRFVLEHIALYCLDDIGGEVLYLTLSLPTWTPLGHCSVQTEWRALRGCAEAGACAGGC